MKYVVTEEQFKTAKESIRNHKLEKIIIEYLDKNLTPNNGWVSLSDYEEELEDNGGELFLYFEEIVDDDKYMWYSVCDNQNISEPLSEGHCPVVVIPTSSYKTLNGIFGNLWKPIFKEWFIKNTGGLPVVQIDRW